MPRMWTRCPFWGHFPAYAKLGGGWHAGCFMAGMSEKLKIEKPDSLAPYFGWDCELKTSLGVCFHLKGTLRPCRGICWYELDLELDEEQGGIYFSWGQYEVFPAEKRIVVTIA